jgi:hypothetical protein
MKKLRYIFLITVSTMCFVSCHDDSHTPETHQCNSCGTEQCECSHSDTTSAVCATCGMENCTMGCGAN